MDNRFLRSKALLGEENFEKLKNANIAVMGLGGVGSYAAESLIRSGVGSLYIYDNDTVTDSNINRQLIALGSTVGKLKTDVLKARLLDINPNAEIYDFPMFISPESDIPFKEFDYIIDAVDNVTAKLFLIEKAKEFSIPIISVMGTGKKLSPEALKISDIQKTHTCPLCKVMRYELKKRGIKKLDVVWSDEMPLENFGISETTHQGREAVASMAFVPGSAGLLAASYVIRKIIRQPISPL